MWRFSRARSNKMSGSVRGGCPATPASMLRKRAERAQSEAMETPFDYMGVAELRKWADRYDIPRYAQLRKVELAQEVRKAYEQLQGG
jgi:hypothetical protein